MIKRITERLVASVRKWKSLPWPPISRCRRGVPTATAGNLLTPAVVLRQTS